MSEPTKAFEPRLEEPPPDGRGKGSRPRDPNGNLARLARAWAAFGAGGWVLLTDDAKSVANVYTGARRAVRVGEFPAFRCRSQKQASGRYKVWVRFLTPDEIATKNGRPAEPTEPPEERPE